MKADLDLKEHAAYLEEIRMYTKHFDFEVHHFWKRNSDPLPGVALHIFRNPRAGLDAHESFRAPEFFPGIQK